MSVHRRKVHWQRSQVALLKSHSPLLRDWLVDSGSLTRRLVKLCGDQFQVKVLSESRESPRFDESKVLLMRDGEQARIRQVLLCWGDVPLVYARTVIPLSSLCGAARRLAYLKGQPLGALLFSSKGLKRGAIQMTQAHSGVLSPELMDAPVWGRRSVFYLAEKPLLVSEFFLPSLIERVACHNKGVY